MKSGHYFMSQTQRQTNENDNSIMDNEVGFFWKFSTVSFCIDKTSLSAALIKSHEIGDLK